ncbi:MAG: FAD-binding protein [Chloroflexi bacterium]|nr:FAD-binding protein [Chloroflexota bacterium]
MSPLEKENARLKPWLPQQWDDEADVVVVGYGGAGGCAAIAAHDAGARALILEKAPVGGGNTATSGGWMFIPGDVSSATAYYRALTRGGVDAEWIPAFAEAIVGLPHQLEEWGAELKYSSASPEYPAFPGSTNVRRVYFAYAERQTEDRGPTNLGIPMFNFIDKQTKRRDIKIMYETPAKGLVQDPITKEILGIRAGSAGREICVKARRGVVLACGGFQNNKEMLVNFLAYTTALPIYPLGTPYNTGDGILMASEVGAKLWHMAGVEFGNFAPKAPSEKFGVGFRLVRQLPAGSQAIYINKMGKRFMNESVVLSHRKDLFQVQYWDHDRAEYPNIPFYMVFDETFKKKGPIVGMAGGWWNIHKLYQWSKDNSAEIEQGWIVKADTIKKLAEKIGVDPVGLAKTISQYNRYCRRGEDAEFDRAKEWLTPIETPPYYATELCEPIINTQGGPKRNTRAQVLDNSDKPIPRLYAAGELGSFWFPLYQGTSNLPEALAFGRIAGEQAAALTPWG